MVDSDCETGLVKDFQIPTYILKPDAEVANVSEVPTCPVIVFINSKSGGQLGVDLLVTFRSLLNENQVFDVGKEAPDKVLRRIDLIPETLKLNGDEFAGSIEERLIVIVSSVTVDTF